MFQINQKDSSAGKKIIKYKSMLDKVAKEG